MLAIMTESQKQELVTSLLIERQNTLKARNEAYNRFVTISITLLTSFLALVVSLTDFKTVPELEVLTFKILATLFGTCILSGALTLYQSVKLMDRQHDNILQKLRSDTLFDS